MKKATITLLLICVAAFAQQKGSFTDTRDKKTYKTAKIGKQTWIAENLNFNAESSVCYDNKPENCDKYGRLYNWNTAIKACPKGWHLPNLKEWQTLVDLAGGEGAAGTKLKAASGWNNDRNGTDDYGFSALPGGNGLSDGSFDGVGIDGNWWNASEEDGDSNYARRESITGFDEDAWGYYGKSDLNSVRCVKD